MNSPAVHVVGAGLAGLAAALAAAQAGARVVVHEAAGHAGGRCRSFHDPVLDRVIDNGNHLVLGVNRAALAYVHAIGGPIQPLSPSIAFADLNDGRRWTVSPGRLPVGLTEILRAAGLPWVKAAATVAERLQDCRGFDDFWQPLCLATLNTPPRQASARLFARVVRALLSAGPAGLRGHLFPTGLSASLVEPALARLRRQGARLYFHRRLTGICQTRLTFQQHVEEIRENDRVILALPPWALDGILPGDFRFSYETIANIHYRLPAAPGLHAPLGLVGGTAQWLFVRGDVASVTISAATVPPDPARIWAEIAPFVAIGTPLPPHRVVLEKRATLCHAPAAIARRPGPTTPLAGMFLAGDWLASPWPCTLESAVSSGLRAAALALARDDLRFS